MILPPPGGSEPPPPSRRSLWQRPVPSIDVPTTPDTPPAKRRSGEMPMVRPEWYHDTDPAPPPDPEEAS